MSMPTKLHIHPRLEATIERFRAQPPQSLIIIGAAGQGSATIARHLAHGSGALLTTVHPTKRQPSGSMAIDEVQGSIAIDDIRELYTLTRSAFTTHQTVIIDTNGRPFTAPAQNALLKLLEEPPAAVSFIIAVHTLDELLPTIISRCALMTVPPITPEQSNNLLNQQAVHDETMRRRLLFMAEGKPAELLRLIDQPDRYEARVVTMQTARTLLQSDSYEQIRIAMTHKDQRPQVLQLIDDMVTQLRRSLASSQQPEDIAALIDRLMIARKHIEGYGNIPLQLSTALLQ